ncbi:PepSY-associated TM helix domain-containing protein [Pseudooceanicola sp. HF7]|uniref:PepSY-associated TM helix domain-containing protein n=1 Tax=Pseudooceanicola sp. HF7 TaxID=2721560 RepID=UPI0014309A67|nr:PepSY-associated TM helix domain-containing protein [Pseudooceanicola sp. HF7]NIZ11343.1 hypothetical protein [Pseudooceanicola sp. HF7]
MSAAPIPSTGRSWWLRQLTLWHRITGAASLSILVFFAVTGFLLNHPGLIPSRGDTEYRELVLPENLMPALADAPDGGTGPLPAPLADWLGAELGLPMGHVEADYDSAEVWIDLPRPGGEGLVILDRESGSAEVEIIRRGWLAVAADLHKGRDSGLAWPLVIDALALGTLLFALSGFAILFIQARARPATWPVTAGGLVFPAILFLLFVHGG